MSYGSEKSGGFNAASKAYKSEPSIQNYLKLRRENPEAEVEVSNLGGFDSVLAMQSEFELHGFSVETMMGILDADQAVISEVSLRLLEELVRHEELSQIGETQLVRREKAIPLKFVDWIIALALEALSWTDSMLMNRDLIVLINARLVGAEPTYQQQVRAHEASRSAVWIGAQLLAQGTKPSIRRIAAILNVSPSTVSRWFEPGEFDAECEKLSVCFNSNGSPKDFFEMKMTKVSNQPE